MKIIIAEDDALSRRMLEAQLQRWGHQVQSFGDGAEALMAIQAGGSPMLAILDWMMPGMDGPEVCRRIRADQEIDQPYLVLLTSKEGTQSTVEGLTAGADDYVIKPFDASVLQARVNVGIRMLELQGKLARRVKELEEALAKVKRLQGLLPICSYCKRVRNDGNYWQQVDAYIAEHTDARLSHGFCPDCFETHVRPQLTELNEQLGEPAGSLNNGH